VFKNSAAVLFSAIYEAFNMAGAVGMVFCSGILNTASVCFYTIYVALTKLLLWVRVKMPFD
jgi:hypothetical protein